MLEFESDQFMLFFVIEQPNFIILLGLEFREPQISDKLEIFLLEIVEEIFNHVIFFLKCDDERVVSIYFGNGFLLFRH